MKYTQIKLLSAYDYPSLEKEINETLEYLYKEGWNIVDIKFSDNHAENSYVSVLIIYNELDEECVID